MSIRLRMIIVLNLFVIALTGLLGWIAQDTAGRLVEERYVNEMVTSASGFLQDKRFPRNDTVMQYLRDLFNAEWIASEYRPDHVIASSLPAESTMEFRSRAPTLGSSGMVHLGGKRYRFAVADVNSAAYDTTRSKGYLFMLVPESQFRQARSRTIERVMGVVLPVALVATVLAVLLSISISRPIRKLASQMDSLPSADAASPPPVPQDMLIHNPAEIRQLARSYDHLLGRLRKTRRQMLQNEQLAALGRISLSVAHELRNPLSGIKMNVRVLQDDDRLKDDPGILAVLREIDRMSLYLDELMNLSPGASPEEVSFTPLRVRLSELAGSVLFILTGRLRHAKIEVHTDFPEDEPEVSVDPNRIRQAMMNLLINAVEASSPGSCIRLKIGRVSGRLRFSVEDSGPGVSVAGQDIFAIFATNKPNGVGLGLYMCKQIIRRHGGEIGFESSKYGATFWFEIPLEFEEAGGPAGNNSEIGEDIES